MGRTARTIGASIVLGLIAIAALTQAAPARLEDTLADTDPTTTSTPSTTSTTSTTPVPPFVYRVGLLSNLTTDNYWAFYGEEPTVWNAYILGPTKPSLYAVETVGASLVPELAIEHQSPQEVEGAWQVTVSLRGDMAWSDGRPITAADIAFTFQTVRRLQLEGSWAQSFPTTVSSIEALDPGRLRITFTERPTLATWPHALGTAPIMPAHAWSETVETIENAESLYALAGTQDVGGGPVTVQSVSDTLIISVANPGYGLGSAPDRVEYHVFEDEGAALEAIRLGDIDTILSPRGLSPEQVETLDDAVAVTTNPSHGVRYLGFNLSQVPMSDHAFRDALALLVERETTTFMDATINPWHDPAAGAALGARYGAPLQVRFEEAIEGLRQAGYSWEVEPTVESGELRQGNGLLRMGEQLPSVTILTTGDAWEPERTARAGEIADTLRLLGFDARHVETDFDTVVDLAFPVGDTGYRYDMYVLGWSLGDPTLPGFYRTLFAADSPINNTGYSSEEFAGQLARFEAANDHESALQAIWQMEATLAHDLPYLLLYRSSITEVYRQDRVRFRIGVATGGIQGRLGGLEDVSPS